MITMVVPTRDRAHTLRRVADSYFRQKGVSEIIFVIDAGTDDTVAVIEDIARQHPAVRRKIVRNPGRVEASQSRNRGVAEAVNDFILFCDDDEYLRPVPYALAMRLLRRRRGGAAQPVVGAV
jgi:glycosyltransferase involved in cell wall biosynthesis